MATHVAPLTASARRWRWTAATAVAALVTASAVVLSPPATASGTDAAALLSAIAASRAAAGLPAYRVAADLTAVAELQAQREAAAHRMFHNPGLTTLVHNWQSVGENVANGPSASWIASALIASAPHRANILSSAFTQVGIGVAVTADGTRWVSEVFRRPAVGSGVGSTVSARSLPQRASRQAVRAPAAGSWPAAPGLSLVARLEVFGRVAAQRVRPGGTAGLLALR